jgi:cytochrome c551/c552
MHAWFAGTSFLLFASVLWMMERDYADEWRPIQTTNALLKAEQIEADLRKMQTDEFKAESAKLKEQAEQAAAEAKTKADDIARAEKELAAFDGELTLATRNVKFKRAERDKARADLDLAVRDERSADVLAALQRIFDAKQDEVNRMERDAALLEDKANVVRNELSSLRSAVTRAESDLKKHYAAMELLEKARSRLDPTGFAKAKLNFMQLPIIDGFNSPFKVHQLWLPELTINFGGMKDVARFDRCITCHLNSDATKVGGMPAFPFDPNGLPHDEHHAGIANAHKSFEGYRHPYATHPRTDLFLTAASPHPQQTFGCTICHEGQGSGTSFHNAQHTPSTPHDFEKWHEKYGWFYNHFWEYPMLPKQLTEASCIKCHHNVTELGVSQKFGNSAPTVYKGFELVEKYGCFGCHEINGYSAGKQIGPDMRIEPTPEEMAEMANDPTAKPGKYRKVGPGLRHYDGKTTPEFTKYWLTDPQIFRPDTRMPKFFGLSNQQDVHGKRFNPVEIAGIAAYLHGASEPIKFDSPKEGYQPDAERGKTLFSQRGCLSCHKHEDFPGITADFGPNLTKTHEKVKPGSEGFNWLYTWIREPERHSAQTRMPNLYLEPEVQGGVEIDPAADIAAYLASKGPAQFSTQEFEPAALNDLVRLFMKGKSLKEAQIDAFLTSRKFPITDKSLVKGDEVELVGETATDEMLLRYVGRRTITRYGCYACHDIPGFEKARPIGTGLADWGRKDPTKLALEHITEYLHHHGEKDGSSTADRIAEATKLDASNAFSSEEERDRETTAAFFYKQLQSHGRAGFLWQKLRESRSYDYKKIETKSYDERIRMPQFPLTEEEIKAISTFVLGLVAEPPREQYVYRPTGAQKARVEGERLIAKYNCKACHMLDLPEISFAAKLDEIEASTKGDADHQAAVDLLMKIKPPRQGLTNTTAKNGDPIVSFHGLLTAAPDPMDDPEDQEWSYTLWETLQVGEKMLFPSSRMLFKNTQKIGEKPARGGEFATWLVEELLRTDSDMKRELAWQASPPPLYREGVKVQTPWLYAFLKNPGKLRYTTVLRMPKFNMTDEEAQALANYFAAVDGAPFPYTDIPQREPEYIAAHGGDEYLTESWKLLNGNLCSKCHAVSGRPYSGGQSKEDIRGPNLEYTASRLRPDWLQLWIFKPMWLTPYTSMPQNYPADKVVDPAFGGDSLKQNTAIRDVLMNYYRLLEREGKFQASATPQGDAAADGAADAAAVPAAGGGGN